MCEVSFGTKSALGYPRCSSTIYAINKYHFNDNKACVQWSKSATSKGLRHIQMRENRIRENIATNFVSICHIEDKRDLADVFTKEMKDTSHFG
jgi:hypothetical protein